MSEQPARRKSHKPEWLRARGYDGLYCPEGPCGCSIDDFAPCVEGPGPECVPAEQHEDGLFYEAKRKRRAEGAAIMPRKRMEAWTIKGVHGLYYGTYPTRWEAIQCHCLDTGRDWKYCRAKGDRAVRVIVREVAHAGEGTP